MPSHSRREDLVRAVPLLARLSDDDRKALATRSRARSYRTGGVIFREGDPGDALHIVVEGSVRIGVLAASGAEATVALLGPGECVGEFSLLDGHPRSATAVATQPTRTLVVTRDAFSRWLSERPTAALALLETLSLRMRRTDEALADLAFLDLTGRLTKRLLDLSAGQQAQGRNDGDPDPATIRITQGELASMLGVSRESVNKQLNQFQRKGWIRLGRGSVTVLDPEALRAIL